MVFERRLEDNLFAIREEILSGSYRHNPYQAFSIHDPKERIIHKAEVKDRVVHQAIVNVIEPLFEKRFIHDSYSCRVGKGTHAAVRRLRTFLRQASENNTKTIYAVKCDVRKFFASINHAALLQLLSQRISEPRIMTLLRNIVTSFSVSSGTGIPLGNLTSQLFANVYLHELDWHVKQTLKVRHYVRYCDDFIMLTSSRKEGLVLAERVDAFLRDNLKVQLHPDKVHVCTWTQGVDFLGYVLLPHVTVMRPDTAQRAIRCATTNNASSYLGLCSHADAYELWCAIRNKTGHLEHSKA
ncbi:MAG: Group II intron-encoded protein LtrA [Nitrosomonadaceae bacterium]|nr:Group II intron-encoded protein LtrA [Nitrosomonadaceae bacterium]